MCTLKLPPGIIIVKMPPNTPFAVVIDETCTEPTLEIPKPDPLPTAIPAEPTKPAVEPVAPTHEINPPLFAGPTWKVKVKIGLTYDFSDITILRKYIKDGRVTNDDVISSDGINWTRIGDIEDLEAWLASHPAEELPPDAEAEVVVPSVEPVEPPPAEE